MSSFDSPRNRFAATSFTSPLGGTTADTPSTPAYDSSGVEDPWGPVTASASEYGSGAASSGMGGLGGFFGGIAAARPQQNIRNILSEDSFPPEYSDLFLQTLQKEAVLSRNQSGGGTSLSLGSLRDTLSLVCGLPALQIDKIINLVSPPGAVGGVGGNAEVGRNRVNRLEFFVALALAAFAQLGKEISIENVSHQRDSLPLPKMDKSSLQPQAVTAIANKRMSNGPSSTDPWNGGSRMTNGQPSLNRQDSTNSASTPLPVSESTDAETAGFGAADGYGSTLGIGGQGGKLPEQEPVTVRFSQGMEGWILKHTVYIVESERRSTMVPRRYSDFVWLLEVLHRRYPFRLLPNLPPKRVAVNGYHFVADEGFLERRRRGLQRFLEKVVNHPVLGSDGVVNTFMTEQSDLTTWRKHHPLSYEEESTSRRLSPSDEMSIPSDLEDKLTSFRSRLPLLIDHWTRVCICLERTARRNEAQASDHVRIRLGLESVVEAERTGWRWGEGVRDVEAVEGHTLAVAERFGRSADILENRSVEFSAATLEKVKSHRELYSTYRDLFGRYDRLGGDQVDRLRKRVEANQRKLDGVREAKKVGWEAEEDKLVGAIEADQRAIEVGLRRRVFIRFCMWNELIFLFRSTTMLSNAYKGFSVEERTFAERLHGNWKLLAEDLRIGEE